MSMIKEYSEEIHQRLTAAISDENASQRRSIISQYLVIDEDMEMNIQRDIVLDVLYVATDFAARNNFNFHSTAALIDIIALEFAALMTPSYDFTRPSTQLIEETKRIFMSKMEASKHTVEMKTWAQIAEYLATNIFPQREAFHYMFHNMPIVVDKTISLCVDTPMRVHAPLSTAE